MKKKGPETLPPSLQAEMEAFKAQKDEKYRVDALMRLTRKLYMGLEPTARNFEAIMADLFSVILCCMPDGVEKDNSPLMGEPRDPHQEEIQWLIPLKEFFYKFNCREYRVKSKDFKIIDRAISRLRDGLCWFGKYFCSSVWHRVCKEGDCWVNTGDIGRKCLWLEDIIGALDDIEDLVEEAVWVDESSYLSQEWRKLEDELRRMAGLPSTQKPAAAADSEQQPFAAPPTTLVVELSDKSKKDLAHAVGTELKKPDDVVCAIKVVERKVDNVNRNVRKNILISRATKRRLDAYWDTTDHDDNEGEFKPDFEGKDDEELLMEAWKAVHSESMKGLRRSVCLNIYKKKHPKATTKDKGFVSFYNAIMYQLRREITYSQS